MCDFGAQFSPNLVDTGTGHESEIHDIGVCTDESLLTPAPASALPEEATASLLTFLRSVCPLVQGFLSRPALSSLDAAMLQLLSVQSEEEEQGGSGQVASLCVALEQPSEDEVPQLVQAQQQQVVQPPSRAHLPGLGLCWSSTGMLAAAFGRRDHVGWCRHTGGVGVWSFAASPLGTLQAVLECPTCVTCAAFHPQQPSLLAAGTHAGELWLWDLARPAAPGQPLARSPTDDSVHRDPIVGLAWAWDATHSRHTLTSLCAAGRLHVWAPLGNALAHPLASFALRGEAQRTAAAAAKPARQRSYSDDADFEEEGGEGVGEGGGRRQQQHPAARPPPALACTALSMATGEGGALLLATVRGSVARCTGVQASAAAWAATEGLRSAAHHAPLPAGGSHFPGCEPTTLAWEVSAREALLLGCSSSSSAGGAASLAQAVRAGERRAREASTAPTPGPVTLGHLYSARLLAFPPPPAVLHLPSHVAAAAGAAGAAVAAAGAAGGGGRGGAALAVPHATLTGIAASPFHRSVLLTCAGDGTFCVRSSLQRQPLLCLEPLDASSSSAGQQQQQQSGEANAATAAPAAAPASLPLMPLTACAWSCARPLLLAVGAASGVVHLYDLFRSTAAAPAMTLLPGGGAWVEGGQVGLLGAAASPGGPAPAGAVQALAFHPRQRRMLAAAYASGAVVLWRLPWRLAQPVQGEAAALEAFLGLEEAW